ncbi:MAG: SufE family protein [Caldilineaceae bacterium]
MSETTFDEKIERCPAALQEIIQEFREVLPRERLELLLEYADDLPDLPARLQEKRDTMEQVHECQTPVFLYTELNDGQDLYLISCASRQRFVATPAFWSMASTAPLLSKFRPPQKMFTCSWGYTKPSPHSGFVVFMPSLST